MRRHRRLRNSRRRSRSIFPSFWSIVGFGLVGGAAYLAYEAVTGTGDALSSLSDTLSSGASSVTGAVSSAYNAVTGGVSSEVSDAENAASGAYGLVTNEFTSIENGINGWWQGL